MIAKEENVRLSKLLSYVLRHNPAHLGIQLDNHGWTDVEILLNQLNKHQEKINFDILEHIVNTNAKKRFSFNEDLTLIRASQGHSIEVELNYTAQIPPTILFHGTAEKNIILIREKGLLKMSRHHVHLSADKETAHKVGQRHGKPVVLSIQSLTMYESGHLFYVSDNGVWLTDHVPASFIE
jgi:putative RNA 2'-phosphotransferase